MDDLIEALTIFKKYQKPTEWPTICAHEVLYVHSVDAELVSKEDAARLDEIGFDYDEDVGSWKSTRFGSA